MKITSFDDFDIWQNVDVQVLRDRANLVIFLYSVLDNFSYFRSIWFVFNVSGDYFKMRCDLSERIIWSGSNMIYFH